MELSKVMTGTRDQEVKALSTIINGVNAALIGMESFFPPTSADGSIDPSWAPKSGITLARAAAPGLWERAKQLGLVVTEAEWQAIKTASYNDAVAVYSDGDGSTTFRLPSTGKGGFTRAVGTDPILNALSDLNKGHEDVLAEHKHAVPMFDGTSQPGRVMFIGENEVNRYPWGHVNFVNTDPDIGIKGTYTTMTLADTIADAHNTMLTSAKTFHKAEETKPVHMFGKVYIYTGALSTQLPTPTADHLAQIAANTAKISEIENNLADGEQYLSLRGGTSTALTGSQKVYWGETLTQKGITYDSANREITVARTGVYKIDWSCITGNPAEEQLRVLLAKNRTTVPAPGANEHLLQTYMATPVALAPVSFSGIVPLQAGDKLTLWLEKGTLYLGNSSGTDAYNFFSIHRIGD